MTRIEQSRTSARSPKESSEDAVSTTMPVDPPEDFQSLVEEVYGACRRYFGQRPAVAAGALFAVGFYLGWKIRP